MDFPVARRAIAVLGLAALLPLAACSSDPASDSENASPEATLEPAATIDPGPPPAVTLLSPGNGEKRELRYGSSGRDSTVTVTHSATSTSQVAGAAPTKDDTPEQSMALTGRPEPDVNGAQRATVRVSDFDSADERRSAQFATADGFEIAWTRSPRGEMSRLTLQAPAEATDAARASVEIMVNAISDAKVIFPEQAIGVGAQWEITRQIPDAVAPTRITTYELTDLQDQRATVRLRTTAPSPAPTLTAPPASGRQEVTLDVRQYDVLEEGVLTLDLLSSVPVSGNTTLTTKAVYADPHSGTKTTFDTRSMLSFRPKE